MTALSALIVVIGTLATAAALYLLRSMFMATRGKRIAAYAEPRRALVVLDLQEGYAGMNARQPATAASPGSLIATVNELIGWAERARMEVAYVTQVFSSDLIVRLHGGRRQGRVMVDRRVRLINNNTFEKNRTDAFSSRSFEQFLIECQVDELYLVGVDAAFCVYYTAQGALNRGYRVFVISDAVRSRNSMATVLERYRRRGIGIVSSAELVSLTSGAEGMDSAGKASVRDGMEQPHEASISPVSKTSSLKST